MDLSDSPDILHKTTEEKELKAVKQIGLGKSSRFLLSTIVRGFFYLLPLPPLRSIYLRLFGSSVGKDSVLKNVRFYNLYRTGLKGLSIGSRCYIGNEVLIDLADQVRIEDDVTVAARVHIITHQNVGYHDHPLQAHLPNLQAPVHIQSGTFIGANAVITAGVTVGKNSIVGACALVREDVPPNTVVAGVPARPIKKLSQDSLS